MNAALWTIQIILAAVFLGSGVVKATWPKARLVESGQTGVAPFPVALVRLTAIAELLAVVGLILPRLTGVAPVLTAVAAAGLAIVMVGAAISHSSLLRADRRAGRSYREARNVAINITLLALCIFVAAGRM